jgi:SAM-dependent methyltransferase
VLARRALPPEYQAWNARWGAPFGKPIPFGGFLRHSTQRRLTDRFPRLRGPFAFQPNSTTRRFEYPWAFHAVDLPPGANVVEIGGGLSGFQFVLAKHEARVTNVDPGEAATGRGWFVDAQSIARLNRAFGTDVALVNTTLEDARLPSDSVDLVYSISTVEHIPPAEVPSLLREVARILRPNGRFVLTVDLFLNLAPFSNRECNRWGTNVAPASLVRESGLELVAGDPTELLGFPEFDAAAVMARLGELLVGDYPVLAQCFVLAKPDD